MAKAKTKSKTGVKTSAKQPAKVAAKRVTKKAAPPAPAPAPAPGSAAGVASTNKEIYRRFCDEVLNGGDFEAAARYLDPVVVSHSPLPGQHPGAAGFITAMTAMRKAFPDLHAVATHVVAEGDHVAARFQVTATHRGDFVGIRATGRAIHYEEFVMVRFAGGRIVEHWAVADGLALMQQLEGTPSH
jgi:predicted ester cyclase